MNIPPETGGPDAARPAPGGSGQRRRWWRWLPGVLAVLLMPKCLVCLAGYVAAAAGLGVAGAEICGVNESGWLASLGAQCNLSPRQTALVVLAASLILAATITFFIRRIYHRLRSDLS